MCNCNLHKLAQCSKATVLFNLISKQIYLSHLHQEVVNFAISQFCTTAAANVRLETAGGRKESEGVGRRERERAKKILHHQFDSAAKKINYCVTRNARWNFSSNEFLYNKSQVSYESKFSGIVRNRFYKNVGFNFQQCFTYFSALCHYFHLFEAR